jgi:hypothetical protein
LLDRAAGGRWRGRTGPRAEALEGKIERGDLAGGDGGGERLRDDTGAERPHAHRARRHTGEAILPVGIRECLERHALDGDAREFKVFAGGGIGDAALDGAGGLSTYGNCRSVEPGGKKSEKIT